MADRFSAIVTLGIVDGGSSAERFHDNRQGDAQTYYRLLSPSYNTEFTLLVQDIFDGKGMIFIGDDGQVGYAINTTTPRTRFHHPTMFRRDSLDS
mmetsp:Transcript_20299/g.23322  ORF Transcript_20299/g.23322 Transcript_20299/m.23322 type:complete len:95 (-) Transcript_20299:1005-1289(-)